MIFSKSFGYALRGVLYISLMHDENRNIPLDEIADNLSLPKHFMGKILKKLVKEGILSSVKGPNGGFYVNKKTRRTSLISLLMITDGLEDFKYCVLKLHKCDGNNPCPLHNQLEGIKNDLLNNLTKTSIDDLLQPDKPNFIKSITTDFHELAMLKDTARHNTTVHK